MIYHTLYYLKVNLFTFGMCNTTLTIYGVLHSLPLQHRIRNYTKLHFLFLINYSFVDYILY